MSTEGKGPDELEAFSCNVSPSTGVLNASLGQGFAPISTAATTATTDKVWSVIRMDQQIVNSQLCFLLCTPNRWHPVASCIETQHSF